MRDIREAIAHRTSRAERAPAPRVAAGSLTGMSAGADAQPRSRRRPAAALRASLRDYLTLTKPKVQSLLLFTTVTTMYVAGDPSLGLVLLTCLGGALSAGGAGAINHAIDRDIDRRWRAPPTARSPRGRISPAAAIAFGVAARLRLLRAAGADRQPAGGGALALAACSATSSSTRSG